MPGYDSCIEKNDERENACLVQTIQKRKMTEQKIDGTPERWTLRKG